MRLPGSVDAARRFRSAIGMAVAGLLLAGCATVDVTPPPTILPSIVVATPAQVAPTTSPAPDASPVAPTPSPSPTRSPELTTLPLLAALPQVKVVTCHTLDAGGGSPGKPPKTVHLRVAADMATKLAVYFITDGYYVVGPAGWRCTAELFGDGGATIAIRSPTDRQAVVSFASTVSYYDVLEWACSVDKKAATARRREFSGACPKSPKGQRLKVTGAGTASLTVAKGVREGLPHEASRYRTVGALDFEPSDWSYAGVTACALPPSTSAVCDAILTTSIRTSDVDGWSVSDIARVPATAKGGPTPDVALAIDAQGADHVVLTTPEGVVYRTNASGEWTTIASWPGFAAPQIVIGIDAVTHVVLESSADHGVYSTSGPFDALPGPQPVPTGGDDLTHGPAVAVDGRGNLFVAGPTEPSVGIGGEPTGPVLVVRRPDGSWTLGRSLPADATRATLLGLPAGGARIAYARAGRVRVAAVSPDGTIAKEMTLPKGFGARTFALVRVAGDRVALAGIAKDAVTVVVWRGGKWQPSAVDTSWKAIRATGISTAFDPRTSKTVLLWNDGGTDGFFTLARGPGKPKAYAWPSLTMLDTDAAADSGSFGLALDTDGIAHVVVPVRQTDGTVVFALAVLSR